MPITLAPEIPRTVACSVAAAILRRALQFSDGTKQELRCSDAIAWAADAVDRCLNGYMTPADAIGSIRNQAWGLPERDPSTGIGMTREALLACALILGESL